jgi:arginyl-tRNA synthetase
LALLWALQQAFKNALTLLWIATPESM